ncbi:MAG: SGNH/GDSL hydrolase family protein [Kiloniellales bacterium]
MRRSRAWLVNFSVIGAGLIAGLILVEAGLRLAGIAYPFPWTFDAELGLALRAGAEGTFREEGDANFRINSQGLRDSEHAIAKPAGVWRIAVLGDSFTEALQVAAKDTFWAVLERELAGCPALGKRKVETLNFGVSGYSTAQALIALRRKVWRYEPNVVLLAFFAGNDVADNSLALSGYPRRPYFRLQGGRLVLDDGFLRSNRFRLQRLAWTGLVDPLIDHSRLVQLLNEVRRGRFAGPGRAAAPEPAAEGVGAEAKAPPEAGVAASVFRPPATPAWRQAWRVTEALLMAMHRETRSQGAAFWLVTLSVGWQVHPDPAVRRQRMQALGADTAFYPEQRLQAFAAQNGINILTLAQPLQRLAEADGVYLHGFIDPNPGEGHWNANGHRRAGELIAERLCRAWTQG